jgi:endonuclease G
MRRSPKYSFAPVLLAMALLPAAALWTNMREYPRPAPRATAFHSLTLPPKEFPKTTELFNKGYSVGYDESLKDPIWVRYTLDWSRRNFTPPSRPKIPFAVDSRTRARVRTEDFTRSGFTRGHMAPSYAIGAFCGADAQAETFRMSNILPQTAACNEGVWNSIERMEADDFAKRFGKIEIICGPIFSDPPQRLPAGIAVPTAFFKVIRRPDGQTIAFVVPQEPGSGRPEKFLASPAEIELATGVQLGVPEVERQRRRAKIW